MRSTLLWMTLFAGPTLADVVPPGPPARGAVPEDLPAPPLPGGAGAPAWVGVLVGGALLLGAVGLVARRGRDEP